MLKFTCRQLQILELIRDAIQHTGFPPTRAEIAAELGFRSANAAEEHLQALARKGAIDIAPGTSRGIRLLPLGDSIISKDELIPVAPSRSAAQPAFAPDRLRTLPLIGQVAAGAPIFAQEHVDATYTVESSLFSMEPDFLLTVRGASMKDAGILDGDILAVKKAATARNGQIVVARLGDEVTVKRYHRAKINIELLPENADFAPIIITPDREDFWLEGLVVGLVRRWS